jgi:hypothetical protein
MNDLSPYQMEYGRDDSNDVSRVDRQIENRTVNRRN